MNDSVFNRVREIIVDKLGVDASEVTMQASFANDLGADSLDTVELIMEFEKVFETNIPDEDAEKIVTVEDAVTYLDAHVGKHDNKGHDHKEEHKGDHKPSDKKGSDKH